MQRIAIFKISGEFPNEVAIAGFSATRSIKISILALGLCLSLFFLNTINAKPLISSRTSEIADNIDHVKGVFWTVQIGVYRGDVPNRIANSLDRLNYELFENGNILYTAGRYDSPRGAEKQLLKAQELGVKDAFTIAYYNGERMSSKRGAELLLGWVEGWGENKTKLLTSDPDGDNNNNNNNNNKKKKKKKKNDSNTATDPQSNLNSKSDKILTSVGSNKPNQDLSLSDLPEFIFDEDNEGFVGPPTRLMRKEHEFKRIHSFRQLTEPGAIILKGGIGAKDVSFGLRADEVVTRALLKVRYTHSPSLISHQSHIKVYLNNELAGLLPILKKKGGTRLFHEIQLDPRTFKSFNQLTFRFIGHYTAVCEDPMHSSMWVDLSKSSQIELSLKKVKLKNDLSLFPEPFFDPRDFSILELPIVFPKNPSFALLKSSGVLASWFGIQADWRGARFPVHLSSLPDKHAVVLATNQSRPKFLRDYPQVTGPTIEMISHPFNSALKLLLIHGRNEEDLDIAVKGLVMGRAVMSGHAVSIKSFNPILARKPYDAPRWIRTDRAMKISELVDNVNELQVNGYRPEPIKVNLRIPVDLFIWRNQGIPVELGYSYTRPVVLDESRLTVKINGQFIEAFNLNESGVQGGPNSKIKIPLIEDWLLNPESDLLIPAFKLAADNQLEFKFSFARLAEEGCKGEPLYNVNAAIDENSILDFTGIPHYAAMPNLSFFASAGFPFTRLADLSETAVIINPEPDRAEIYAFLNVLARMGSSTGYPALNYTLINHHQIVEALDKDILIIGALPGRYLDAQWNEDLPLLLDVTARAIEQPIYAPQGFSSVFGFPERNDTRIGLSVKMKTTGPIGAMVGMESPFTPKRSVVVLMASHSNTLADMSEQLIDAAIIQKVRGSAVVFHPHQVESFTVGDRYYVGSLTPLSLVWYYLSSHPILMAIAAIIAVFVMAFTLLQALKIVARKRLNRPASMQRPPR